MESGDNSARLSAEEEVLAQSSHSDNAENADGGATDSGVPKAAPSRRRACKDSCMVADCHRKLNTPYEKRYRLCSPHMKAPQFMVSGRLCRWCQKCGKFHALTDFDDLKKSCRASLARHNERQKEARMRRYESTSALQQAGAPPLAMELRRKADNESEDRIIACAASLPISRPHAPWETFLTPQHTMLPPMHVGASSLQLAAAATPMLVPQAQAQASDDALSCSPPVTSVATPFHTHAAPSMEMHALPLSPIDDDIADAFCAAVHAAADAAVKALPSPVSITGVGAVLTHAALLEPSLDAQEAHELRALGFGQLDPAFMPPVLEIPL